MIQWNKVTWYSWTLAGIIFLLVVPFLTWYFIGQYQEIAIVNSKIQNIPFVLEPKNLTQSTHFFSGNTECDNTPNYFILSTSPTGDVVSNILIKYKKTKDQVVACNYTVRKNDFELTDVGAAYFMMIQKNLLFLDIGTAPFPRGLAIYNLDTRKKVFRDSYASVVSTTTDGNFVKYWSPSDVSVTAENCPEYFNNTDSLGTIIENYVSLDLSTFKKTDLGPTRCSLTQ